MRFFRSSGTVAIVLVLASAVMAQDGRSLPPIERAAELLKQLDDDRFDRRRRAAEELTALASQPEAAAWLSRECQRLLRNPAASFEVRVQLKLLIPKLPPANVDQPGEVQDFEVARLAGLLEDRSYAVRLGAEQRLEWLIAEPRRATALLQLLSQRLNDSGMTPDSRARLSALEDKARGAWLASDPVTWQLPAVTDAQIQRMIEELVKAASDRQHAPSGPAPAASRQLLDLMARDEYVPRIATMLQARLNDERLSPVAAGRLNDLLDWTKPALVAEIWQFQQHITIQHLWINVPRQTEGALRPSHFDRIDDKTAHCVSGSNLTPGDYPVGLAIAHPEHPDWMCHIQNLPTPRRRMLYDYAVKVDQAERLKAITERTLQAAIKDKRHFTDLQILLFNELDAATIGKLMGPYLKTVEDRAGESGPFTPGGENASHHGRICAQLAEMGTKEAAPGLIEALAAKRFLPAGDESDPYVWQWIAPLSIAQRDPWANVDDWLASLIEREDLLYAGAPIEEETEAAEGDLPNPNRKPRTTPPPELGATAAAILLARHDADPSVFGIEAVPYHMIEEYELSPSRFSSPQRRQEVVRWWQAEKRRIAARQAL